MVKVTRAQLWHFLFFCGKELDFVHYQNEVKENEAEENQLDESTFDALKAADINDIVSDQDASENNLGGDDLVNVADSVLQAVKDGYTVVTWYGDENEALVAGVRSGPVPVAVVD
jgi:hypothetical protein